MRRRLFDSVKAGCAQQQKQLAGSAGGGGGGVPEFVPAGAVAYANFANDRYYAGSAEVSDADVLSDPSKIVAASGLVFSNGDTVQTVLGDFAAALLGSSATVVVEVDVIIPNFPAILVANNSDDSEETFYLYVFGAQYVAGAGHYGTGSSEASGVTSMVNGINRIAATFSPSKVSVSANGETAVTDGTSVTATATRVLIGGYSPAETLTLSEPFIVRSITVYPVKDDADLPALSTVS